VKFFASLRELVGTDHMQISLPQANLSIAQLKVQLHTSLPAEAMQALLAANVRVALNQHLIDDESMKLAEGDEVAFLPPVTGG